MDFTEINPTTVTIWSYITSAPWYHPTTPMEWVESLTIFFLATLGLILLRWLYAKFPEQPASASALVPSLENSANNTPVHSLKKLVQSTWRCFVLPLLTLLYVCAICGAIMCTPFYTPACNPLLWGLFSITATYSFVAIINNLLKKVDKNSPGGKFLINLKWNFSCILFLLLIYPAVARNITTSHENAIYFKFYARFIICLPLFLLLCNFAKGCNYPLKFIHKLPLFFIVFITPIFPLFAKTLPKWAFILRYWIVASSICFLVYYIFVRDFDRLYTNHSTVLYHLVTAFRWPFFWIAATYGYSQFLAHSYKLTQFYPYFEGVRCTLAIISIWYGINTLLSVNNNNTNNNFLDLIFDKLAQNHPQFSLATTYRHLAIAVISFLSNFSFLFVCYYILKSYFGVQTPIFYAALYLLTGLKFNNIYSLLENITHISQSNWYILTDSFRGPLKTAIFICFLHYAAECLPLSKYFTTNNFWNITHHICVIICFFYGFWELTSHENLNLFFNGINKTKDTVTEKIGRTELQKMYPRLLSHIIRTIVTTGVLLLIFKELGYDINAFAAFVSANLVAVGFLIQEPLTNYFNSLILMKDKLLSQGDWVIINNIEGEVVAINYRCTIIRKFTQEYAYIPNKTIMNSPIINLSRMKRRRYETNFHLSYDLEAPVLEKIITDIRQYLTDLPDRVPDYAPRVYFSDFGDSAAIINVMVYIQLSEEDQWLLKYEKWLNIKHNINLKIINIVKENGAEIAV